MKIGVAGPIATENIMHLLSNIENLPEGYKGAPLLGTLITELIKRGHEVIAYTTDTSLYRSNGKTIQVNGGNGLSIRYIPSRPRAYRPNGYRPGRIIDFFAYERQGLEQAIRNDKPDIIHAHWTYEFALAALATGLPTVVTAHDSPLQILRFTRSLYRLGRYIMAKKVFRKISMLTVVSPYLINKLPRKIRDKAIIVPNPVDTNTLFEKNTNINSELPKNGKYKIAMVLNGWGKRKNAEPAIQAFSDFKRNNPQSELFLFGNGFGPGEVADEWVKKKGCSSGVTFIGHITFEQLIDQLATVHLLIHPSLEESFGMSVAEAMALGIPVIGGINSGAVPWVVESGGLLVDVKNTDEIRKAIDRLLLDEVFYQKCRKGALERIKNKFSVSAVTTRYEAIYNQTIKLESKKRNGYKNAAEVA